MTQTADGSSTLHATGTAVVVGFVVVAHFVALLFAPHRAVGIAFVFGTLIGLGTGWLAWATTTGRFPLKRLLQESEFRAVRDKDGRIDLQGLEFAAWPLGALLVAFVQYLFAAEAWWALATGFVVAGAGYPATAWYLRQRRSTNPPADPL